MLQTQEVVNFRSVVKLFKSARNENVCYCCKTHTLCPDNHISGRSLHQILISWLCSASCIALLHLFTTIPEWDSILVYHYYYQGYCTFVLLQNARQATTVCSVTTHVPVQVELSVIMWVGSVCVHLVSMAKNVNKVSISFKYYRVHVFNIIYLFVLCTVAMTFIVLTYK